MKEIRNYQKELYVKNEEERKKKIGEIMNKSNNVESRILEIKNIIISLQLDVNYYYKYEELQEIKEEIYNSYLGILNLKDKIVKL